MKSPVLSICVCCRNAYPRVKDTVHSLLCQTADAALYEILIVDNDSDDSEPLQAFINGLGMSADRMRLIVETDTGLAHARNRAVRESRGDYVFFIDDDAVANSRLVEHYIHSIHEHQPDVIGGNVLPLFEIQPSIEFGANFWPQWSLKHFGNVDRWLQDGEYFIGTNIGASRHHLIARPFNPELGRKGDSLKGGEEWYLGEACYRRRFIAGAYVFHKIPEKRMKADYFANRLLAIKNQRRQRISRMRLIFEWLRSVASELRRCLKKILFHATLRYMIWQKYNKSG